MDFTLVRRASELIGDTNEGLSGNQIVKYCLDYALQYDVELKHPSYPFQNNVQNKRTALYENLLCFTEDQQIHIIKELCELPKFESKKDILELNNSIIRRTSNTPYIKLNTTTIDTTLLWLETFPDALKPYQDALSKYKAGIYQRNILDDMRLSLEILVKKLLANGKSLENNKNEIGQKLKQENVPTELREMVTKLINHYTDYQNTHVKHNDNVKENEIEFIIEFTSAMMKLLIKSL